MNDQQITDNNIEIGGEIEPNDLPDNFPESIQQATHDLQQ